MMEDVRLKSVPYELDGKTYELCCNFNVLADLETEYGSILRMLNRIGPMAVTRSALAYMLNDFAELKGWPGRYTPRQIGRTLEALDFVAISKLSDTVIKLVTDAAVIRAVPAVADGAASSATGGDTNVRAEQALPPREGDAGNGESAEATATV